MKRILSSSLLVAALAVAFTGCLKDKGFDNGTYGINDPDTQPPGVGFPRAAGVSKYSIGVDLSTSPQSVTGVVYVNLESGTPASSDIHITLTINDALRTAYNTANGTNILQLPASAYSLALNLTIPAGGRNAEVPIVLPNTSLLNPNNTYGLGITISAVDGGYKIASNLKDLLVEIGLKNKYDGKYTLRGYHNRAPYTFPFVTPVEMWTTGPASVAMFWPTGGDFGQPIGTAPGVVNWYGPAVSGNFFFDPTTNLCTSVVPMPAATVTLAMVTLDNTVDDNPDGPIVNRYDPVSKRMWLTYQYNGNNLRRFYDTLIYTGPR